jgi:hypothetical protein
MSVLAALNRARSDRYICCQEHDLRHPKNERKGASNAPVESSQNLYFRERVELVNENRDGPANSKSNLSADRSREELDLLELYLSLPKKQRDKQFAGTLRAAELAGLAQRTIQLWIECGLIQAVLVGRKYQVHLDSLWEYLRSLRG